MRLIISTAAATLLLSACQVSKDDANDSVSVTYNEDLAENTVADLGNSAENLAADVSNEVGEAADKVKNTDVDVTVDTNTQDNR
jgi:hypothetical protein